jgi:hypothetical protein
VAGHGAQAPRLVDPLAELLQRRLFGCRDVDDLPVRRGGR